MSLLNKYHRGKMKNYFYFLFIILLFLCQCSPQNISGVYGNKKQTHNYFELKVDGSFFLKVNGEGFAGTYKLDDNILTFIFADGKAFQASIQNKEIKDDKGGEWVLWTAGKTGLDYEVEKASQKNKDMLLELGENLGFMAQQYYRKPSKLGGGGNEFIGWSIPNALVRPGYGEISVENIESQSLSIIAIGDKIGEDGQNFIKIIFTVSPKDVKTKIIN